MKWKVNLSSFTYKTSIKPYLVSWGELHPMVVKEIGSIYRGRVGIITFVAAIITFILTGFDILQRFIEGNKALYATDINSIVFALITFTMAVYINRNPIHKMSAILAFKVTLLFVAIAFAHGLVILIVGTTTQASEIFLIMIFLAAAGVIPLPSQSFNLLMMVSITFAITVILVLAKPEENKVLQSFLILLVGFLSIVINAINFDHWRKSIHNRFKERQAREQLEKFLNILAHDLRNPVGNMVGLLELSEKKLKSTSAEDALRLLGHARSTASKTYNLLENLLFWARSRGGSLKPEWIGLKLPEEIKGIVNEMEGQAMEKEIKIEMKNDGPDIVKNDPKLLQTILRNLLTNAIKFTPSSGHIQIRTNHSGTPNHFCITVADNGIGMDSKTLQHLQNFEKIVSRPGTKDEPGHGLGLMLVFELTKRLNGHIQIDSNPGSGTAININLPVNFK